MKVLCLATSSRDCTNKWRSLEAIGHEVDVQLYDDRPHARHGELVSYAHAGGFDLVVVIGAVEQYHGRPVPHPDVFRSINEKVPTVMLCGDAADPPWWPMLEEYHKARCFSVIVNMDGSFETPIAGFEEGLTRLTPIDVRPFVGKSWNDRYIRLGMVGGGGAIRRVLIMEGFGKLGADIRGVGNSYDEMAAIMCSTRVTFNVGISGSGARLQVKGRVVEAGFAGCALLELEGSPAARWFVPGVDYIPYQDATDAIRTLNQMTDSQVEEMATRFHHQVATVHHPIHFWSAVLNRIKETSI